jgi:ParB family chromosome partitioning protein
LTQNEVPNFPTTEAEGYELDERLTTPSEFVGDGWNNGTASDFREFRKKGKEFIEGELIRHLAALLQGSKKDMNDLIDREVKTDIRAVWTPTAENFFKRVGGPYLNDLWCELLDLKADDTKAKAFANLKKGDKAKELEKLFSDPEARKAQGVTKKQAAKIAKWLPEGMK